MKIIDVETFYLKLPNIENRTDSSQDTLLIRITTDAGIVGWGEVDGCPSAVKAIIDAPYSHTMVTGLKRLLIGENPLDTGRLWSLMHRSTIFFGRAGATLQAMAGIDIALWDIKGKVLASLFPPCLAARFATRCGSTRQTCSSLRWRQPSIAPRRPSILGIPA